MVVVHGFLKDLTKVVNYSSLRHRTWPLKDKLRRSSHFDACFSMLEPKHVLGHCLPSLGEKAPESRYQVFQRKPLGIFSCQRFQMVYYISRLVFVISTCQFIHTYHTYKYCSHIVIKLVSIPTKIIFQIYSIAFVYTSIGSS